MQFVSLDYSKMTPGFGVTVCLGNLTSCIMLQAVLVSLSLPAESFSSALNLPKYLPANMSIS